MSAKTISTTTWKFVHTLCDCDYNRSIKAGEFRGGLMYEYKVFKGDEHVATFRRSVAGSKWELRDRIDRPIKKPGSEYGLHRGDECRSVALFENFMDEYTHFIPSAPECAAWQRSEVKRKIREKEAKAKAIARAKVERAAPALLKALKLYVESHEARNARLPDHSAIGATRLSIGRAAIAKALGGVYKAPVQKHPANEFDDVLETRRSGLRELCKQLRLEKPTWSKNRIITHAKVLWTTPRVAGSKNGAVVSTKNPHYKG